MKSLIRNIIIVLIVCLSAIPRATSQQYKCGSEIDLQLIQQTNPALYSRLMEIEQQTQNYINAFTSNSVTNARLVNPNGIITIPVVVHILHNGEALGIGKNISDAQIQSQIDVLNEDFRRLNPDRVNTPLAFQTVAADAKIEFRLACVDPNGNPTNGITRTYTSKNKFDPQGNKYLDGSFDEMAIGIKYSSKGGIDAWPTDRYLNIWVCDLAQSLGGYAQFPAFYTIKPNTDGVVVQYNFFGRVGNLQSNRNEGRVCTHEIGHYFNLRHIWGDQACGDDRVDDTPLQGSKNTGCPTFPYYSGCEAPTNGDMFMNYMDYTNDNCQNIFTLGQSLRMRAVLAQGGPRENFYFNIQNPKRSVCNKFSLTANNQLCTTPTIWTVINGPVTILRGQGTNTINLQQTGTGYAIVRAMTGNYQDDEQIYVGNPVIPNFANPGQAKQISPGVWNGIVKFNPTINNAPYTWKVDGNVMPNSTGSAVNFSISDCNGLSSFYQDYTITASATNACGSSDRCAVYRYSCSNSGTTKTLNYYNPCYIVNRPAPNRFILSDDSAANHLQIDVATLSEDMFAQLYPDPDSLSSELVQTVTVYDVEGNVVQQTDTVNAKHTNLDLSGLPEGSYNVVVDGNNGYTEQQTYKLNLVKTEQELAEEIATGNYTIPTPDEADRKEVLKQQLFKELLNKDSLVNASTILQNFMATKDLENYGFIRKITEAFDNGDTATVSTLLSQWVPQNQQDQNCIDYFNLYLRLLSNDTFTYTDINNMYDLANRCPLKDGEIIYAARSLYNFMTESNEKFEFACDGAANRGTKRKAAPAKSRYLPTVIKVYPNPAKGSFNLDFPATEKGQSTITLTDVFGKKVLQKTVSQRLNNITLPTGTATGIYMIHIINQKTGKQQTQKIVVKS